MTHAVSLTKPGIRAGQNPVASARPTLIFSPTCADGSTATRPRRESYSTPWTGASPSQARRMANRSWLRGALEQLENIDNDAEEGGLESPSKNARTLARRFIQEFAHMGLPTASVFADEGRSVSIQMEVTGFVFLLTCSEGGRGVYNISHRTRSSINSLEASYTIASLEEIGASAVLTQLRCLIKPLTKHAERTDRLR